MKTIKNKEVKTWFVGVQSIQWLTMQLDPQLSDDPQYRISRHDDKAFWKASSIRATLTPGIMKMDTMAEKALLPCPSDDIPL